MRWNRSDLWSGLLLVAGALAVSLERAPLSESYRRVATKHDVYALPPAREVVTLSFGYRAAAADLIFGHLLVSAGIHTAEKRLFEDAAAYLEAINELDPKFRAPYRFADAIITLQTVETPEEGYREARRILLRGTRELPYDQELWSAAGQFLAYLAPPRLHDPAEQRQFRLDGARLLAHACELVGQNENIPHHCITAAALFSDAGNVAASRAFLERVLMVSDDSQVRALAEGKLRALAGADAEQQLLALSQRFERAWRLDLPFVTRTEMAAVGPSFDPARCAGKLAAPAGDPCTTSFRERFASP